MELQLTSLIDSSLTLAIIMFTGIYIFMVGMILFFVYKDSMKRKMNTSTWLLLIIMFGFFGLFAYLIIRINHPRKR